MRGPFRFAARAWCPVAVLVGCVATAPALLAGAPAGSATPAGVVQSGFDAPWFVPAAPHSPGLGGYLLSKAPATASASGRFRVAAVTCPSTVPDSILVEGLAIRGSITTKPDSTVGEVFEQCAGGALTIAASVSAAGSPGGTPSFAPAAGDVILVKLSQSATASSVILSDLTQKRGISHHSGGAISTEVFEGDSAGFSQTGVAYPVPTFTTDRFSAGRIDGVTVAASGASAVNMVSTGGTLQIKTGLLGKAGNAWVEIFEHN